MIKHYRIVCSVDGDGHFGIVPLYLIQHIHDMAKSCDHDINICSWVDLFCSCHYSSLFTAALMIKECENELCYTPKEILNFYLERGEFLIDKSGNSNQIKNFIINRFFKDTNSYDLKKHFLFLAKNADENKSFSFSSVDEKHKYLSLATILNCCTTHQDSAKKSTFENKSLVESDIINPSVQAYNLATLLYPNEHIVLLSFGFKKKNQGHIVDPDLYLKAKASESDTFTYFRFQPEVHSENTYDLIRTAKHYINHNQNLFNYLFNFIQLKRA